MPGSTHQSRVAAPFTAWPAFLHYDSCGPYGGVHAASERAPEAVLATSYCWWQRGSTPRWNFHGLLPWDKRLVTLRFVVMTPMAAIPHYLLGA